MRRVSTFRSCAPLCLPTGYWLLSTLHVDEGVAAVEGDPFGFERGVFKELVLVVAVDDDARGPAPAPREVCDLVGAFELQGLAVRVVGEAARGVELRGALDGVEVDDGQSAEALRVGLGEDAPGRLLAGDAAEH